MKKKKDSAKSEQNSLEVKESVMEMHGVIDEAMPGTLFRVICENGHKVIATLSGKLRVNHIRLLPGDQVAVEVSPYDLTRGRVTWRKLLFKTTYNNPWYNYAINVTNLIHSCDSKMGSFSTYQVCCCGWFYKIE